jgi:hypothetical protein
MDTRWSRATNCVHTAKQVLAGINKTHRALGASAILAGAFEFGLEGAHPSANLE